MTTDRTLTDADIQTCFESCVFAICSDKPDQCIICGRSKSGDFNEHPTSGRYGTFVFETEENLELITSIPLQSLADWLPAVNGVIIEMKTVPDTNCSRKRYTVKASWITRDDNEPIC